MDYKPTIPAPVSDFQGRTVEINQFVQILKNASQRKKVAVCGIRGLGGIGKTQLAYKIAQLVANDFSDGQLLVNLRGMSQDWLRPEQVIKAILEDLGISSNLPDDLGRLRSIYYSFLNGKNILILADNARNLKQVKSLSPPPNCALLFTSRQRFRFPGMKDSDLIDLNVFPQIVAEQLLLDICPRIGEATVHLARLCGYLPLALRISATALAEEPMHDVKIYHTRLEAERLNLLSDQNEFNDPDMSVRASFNLSYQTLSPMEQLVLRQLSIIPASFGINMAEAVIDTSKLEQFTSLSKDIHQDIEDGSNESTISPSRLRQLLSKHFSISDLKNFCFDLGINYENLSGENKGDKERELIAYLHRRGEIEKLINLHPKIMEQFTHSSPETAPSAMEELLPSLYRRSLLQWKEDFRGYSFHDLVREFAQEQLNGEEIQTVRLRLANYYRQIGSNIDINVGELFHRSIMQFSTILLSESITKIETRYQTISESRYQTRYRHALYYLKNHTNDWQWINASWLQIERAWIFVSKNNANLTFDYFSAFCPYMKRRSLWYEIVSWGKSTLKIMEGVGRKIEKAIILNAIGIAYMNSSHLSDAVEFFKQAQETLQETENPQSESRILGNLAAANAYLGKTNEAFANLETQLQLAKKSGDHYSEMCALHNLGSIHLSLGQPKLAISLQEQALIIARQYDYQHDIGLILARLGDSYKSAGNLSDASNFYIQALIIINKGEDLYEQIGILNSLGIIFAYQGETLEAIEYYKVAKHISETTSNFRHTSNILNNMGSLFALDGNFDNAHDYYQAALKLAEQANDRLTKARVLGCLGLMYIDSNELERAISLFEESLSLAREIGDQYGEGDAHRNLGHAFLASSNIDTAINYYNQQLKIAQKTDDFLTISNALRNLGNCYADLGQINLAITTYYEPSLNIARERIDNYGECLTLGALANAHARLSQKEKAIEYYERTLEFANSLGNQRLKAVALWNWGLVHEASGEYNQAVEKMQAAIDYEQAINHPNVERDLKRLEEIRRQIGEE